MRTVTFTNKLGLAEATNTVQNVGLYALFPAQMTAVSVTLGVVMLGALAQYVRKKIHSWNKCIKPMSDEAFRKSRAMFRCYTCKDCFHTKDAFDDHNRKSEMHYLKTMYLRDRTWYKNQVDYLQIIVKRGRIQWLGRTEETCEISCVNVAQDGSKIYICKIFELDYFGLEMKIKYGSNYCLEKGDSFKINIKAKPTTFSLPGFLNYAVVLKVAKNNVDDYNYLLLIDETSIRARESLNPVRQQLTLSSKNHVRGLKTQHYNDITGHICAGTSLIYPKATESVIPARLRELPSSSRNQMPCVQTQNRNNNAGRISAESSESRLRPTIPDGVISTLTDGISIIYHQPKCTEPVKRAGKMPKSKMKLEEYPIPPFLVLLMEKGFKASSIPFPWSAENEKTFVNISNLICEANTLKLQHNKEALREHNYIGRLHIIMWLEEYQALEEIRSFDRENINFLTDKLSQNLVGIPFPDLSEKKFEADFFTITSKEFIIPKKMWQGKIELIEENAVYIKLNKLFFELEAWKYKVDIKFGCNRNQFKMKHAALDKLRQFVWQEYLFPRTFERNPNRIQLRPFFNESINGNEHQVQAITNIVQNRAFPAPYILFGPPGTGKTATLVEAIVQIWSTMRYCRICVCASSNAAANEITKRLLRYIPIRDLIRVYALSCKEEDIIPEVSDCCNYDSSSKKAFVPCIDELIRRKIVVMTPATSGRFVSSGIAFNYVFMDEAGHALETDVLIPISGFLHNAQCSLVLSGDPQQLGPVVKSPYATALGFDMSLLERLMTQCDIYKKNPISGKYNPKVITMLVNNYRSHENILRIPNQRFYNNELQAKASKDLVNSLCQWGRLPKKGFPIIFHGVKGIEQQEIDSSSYYNSKEANVVVKYIRNLFEDTQIEQSEIGIISPYRAQIQVIKQRSLRWPKIDVASVDEFQGQERKVIIMSTVRSRNASSAKDYKYGLGFLKNEKRFNVSITRAVALLIVIGDPDVLQCDPNWRTFIKYCAENRAFIGEQARGTVPDDFVPNVNQKDIYIT